MLLHLDAVIFDFDGVIANSEPLHFEAFGRTLADEGFSLSREDYYARYLGFDDVGAFAAVARDAGRPLTPQAVGAMVATKGRHMQSLMHGPEVLFPGAAAFIRACAAAVPIAICSGALRHEILEVLERAGIRDLVPTVVASGDTPESKPSPASSPSRGSTAPSGAACGLTAQWRSRTRAGALSPPGVRGCGWSA